MPDDAEYLEHCMNKYANIGYTHSNCHFCAQCWRRALIGKWRRSY